jgi:hypothetical protein
MPERPTLRSFSRLATVHAVRARPLLVFNELTNINQVQSAMNAVAPSVGVKMPTKTEDSIVGSMKDLDMGLRVQLLVKVRGLAKEDLEKVVYKARQVCPYSRATKDNVYTTVRCETM